jgi:hypothetical protein
MAIDKISAQFKLKGGRNQIWTDWNRHSSRVCSACCIEMDEKESGPSDLQWVERREKVVQQAIDDGDLGKLRELAALPGGFGSNEMRKRVW